MTQTIHDTMDSATREAGLELRFHQSGEAYERAKAVADALGLDLRSYLLLCIKEGHVLLKRRAGLEEPASGTVLDTPAILRRPAPTDPKERAMWEEVRALFE